MGREFRTGHLDLGDLSADERLLARLAVVAAVVACATILLVGAGAGGLAGTVQVPGLWIASKTLVSVPILPLAVGSLGGAVAAAALVHWAIAAHSTGGRLVLASIGLIAGALGANLIVTARTVAVMEDSGTSSLLSVSGVATPMGVAILVAGALIAGTPRSIASRRPWAWSLAAALCFVAPLPLLLIAGVVRGELSADALAQNPTFPATLSGQAALAAALVLSVVAIGQMVVPIAVWQALTFARSARRDVGLRVASASRSRPAVLPILLTIKLAWLAAGFLGFLPAALGGSSDAWARARDSGLLAWSLAALMGAAIGFWVAHHRRVPASERGFSRAAVSVAVLFAGGSIAASVLLLLGQVVALVPSTPGGPCEGGFLGRGPGGAIECALNGLSDGQAAWFVIAALLPGAMGLWILWRRGRERMAGAFLLVLFAWVAPRALSVAAVTFFPGAPLPTAFIGFLTIDSVLTIVLAILALHGWLGGKTDADGYAITLLLVVATIVAEAGLFVPESLAPAVFYLVLLAPLAYELLFDSERLNQRDPSRPARLSRALGTRAALLTILAAQLGLSEAFAMGDQIQEVVFVAFAPAFAVWLVAASLAEAPQPIRASPGSYRRWASALVGAGLALVLSVPLVLAAQGAGQTSGGAIPPAIPTMTSAPTLTLAPVTPEPRARFLELNQRILEGSTLRAALVQELTTYLEPINLAGLADVGQRLQAQAQTELAWLAVHPAGGCGSGAWAAYQSMALDQDAVGAALARPVPSAGESDWAAQVLSAFKGLLSSMDQMGPALEQGAIECGVTPQTSASP